MPAPFSRSEDSRDRIDAALDCEPSEPGTRRKEKIRRAVGVAMNHWVRHARAGGQDRPSPVTSLPRPRGLEIPASAHSMYPPRRRELHFHAGFFRSLARTFIWIFAAIRFYWRILMDQFAGRNTQARRAWRLRQTFQEMGTTFIKIGQQLSMRMDILPYAYTRELAEMFDNVPSFPFSQATGIIERTTGRKLSDIFTYIDPEPIGSASIACVWQAVLCNGERVAVKVRRPGIGELLAADMRALRWLLQIAELIIFRPGWSGNFVFELRQALTDELNFVREARFTDMFRNHMRKTRQLRFASSPKVYFEHSGMEVLVTEFVHGVWLTEVFSALESGDPGALAKLEEMSFDRVVVARRILLISRYGHFEDFFFHADLHPANILIQPDNRIVLIDFGSCGSFSVRELVAWRRMFDAQSLDDVGGMVQACMGIIEPMPPVDKDQFALRLESLFWEDLYAIKSRKSEWWERISARLWIGFLKLAREFSIPMRLNSLLMMRAIMLADTIAGRLDHDTNPYREYRHYEKGAGKRARKRVIRLVRRLLGPSKWTRMEQGIESGLTGLYRMERAVQSLAYIRILPLIGKAALASFLALRTLVLVGLGASVIALYVLFRYHPEMTFLDVLVQYVLQNGYFQLIALIPILPALRRIFYRLKDPEYERRQ